MNTNSANAALGAVKMRNNQGAILSRLLTGVGLVLVSAFFIWTPHLHTAFAILVMLFAVIGINEYYSMAWHKGLTSEIFGGMLSVIAMHTAALVFGAAALNLVFYLCVVALAWLHILRKHRTISGIAVTMFGILYVGWLPAHFILLHEDPQLGAGMVTLLIVAVALSDTGAFFSGKAFGKHKLAPVTSPNKTWEGAIGGTVTAMLGMTLIYWLRHSLGWEAWPDWSLMRYLATGFALAFLGQIGDLVESLLKRDADFKDSGTILPGHGGVLDRCDAMLFSAPLLYYIM